MVPGRVLPLPYPYCCGAGGTKRFVLLYLDGLLQGALLPSTFGSASGRVSGRAGYDICPDPYADDPAQTLVSSQSSWAGNRAPSASVKT